MSIYLEEFEVRTYCRLADVMDMINVFDQVMMQDLENDSGRLDFWRSLHITSSLAIRFHCRYINYTRIIVRSLCRPASRA